MNERDNPNGLNRLIQENSAKRDYKDSPDKQKETIKSMEYDLWNLGSQMFSDNDQGNNLTKYDREKLQMKIEEMKREIDKHNTLMAQ